MEGAVPLQDKSQEELTQVGRAAGQGRAAQAWLAGPRSATCGGSTSNHSPTDSLYPRTQPPQQIMTQYEQEISVINGNRS